MASRSTICPYCGASVSPTARYCDHCGTPLMRHDQPAPHRRRRRPMDRVAPSLFLIVLLLAFTTGVMGGFRYHSGQWPWQPSIAASAGETPRDEPQAVHLPYPGGQKDPAVERYLRAVVSVAVRGERGSKNGSGFLVGGGYIVTSAHVVEGYRGCVNVIDDNGATHLGTVVHLDSNRDVALLYVPTFLNWPDLLTLRETPPVRGDQVWVLGSPKGTPNATLLPAEVEATGVAKRIDDRYYADLIQFRGATVVHGSSGSPLLHRESGQVVGVVTAAADAPVAYAVPVDPSLTALIGEWRERPVTSTCEAGAPAQSVQLVLATITPLSGPYGVWGNDLASGVELALRDMEADLRKVGYQVVLSRHDDQGDAVLARELAGRVAYDQEVIGVVGSLTSPVTAAIAEALAESRLAMVAPTAGDDQLTRRGWPHFNQLVASEARLQAAVATYAKERLKARGILMVLDGSEAARKRAESFAISAQIISLPIAGRVEVGAAVDAAELKRQLQAAGADVLYYAGHSQTGFEVVRALRRVGVLVPVIGGPELYSPSFEAMTGPDWHSIYFAHFTDGGDERFVRHFETILGKPTRRYAMFGYDAAHVILEALIRYGERHPGRVPSREELAALVRETRGYRGWAVDVAFDRATGENQAAPVHIFEWVSGHHELRP